MKVTEGKPVNHAVIQALEQQEAQAMLRGDIAALESFWSDDLLVNSTANIIAGKAMLLDLIRSGRLRLKEYQRRTLRLEGDGKLVIAAGNETSQLATEGAAEQLFCSYMNIWTKQRQSWKLIGRHVGLIGKRPLQP